MPRENGMFIVKGSTRIARCYPSLGIVIKTPRDCFGDFGIKANKAEAYLWKKTRNQLLAPVLFSFFGKVIVMRYYSSGVNEGDKTRYGLITPEIMALLMEDYPKTFVGITEKILGGKLAWLLEDGHDAASENFRLTNKGKLVMVDYGISYPEHQEKFIEFLDKYGQKLVDEYQEP